MPAALTYHEPGIVTILVLSSFLLLENIVNYVLDRVLFCGLIGQIAIGVAWGTPGGKWLSEDVENVIMQLGFLGLILIVYEGRKIYKMRTIIRLTRSSGGLSTHLKTLRSHLFLSSIIAIIGISAPIALSFALRGFMDITPLQAFAAGAALCSTSLGTTFTVLSTSGLSQSRLGVVLSSAAMMDDIIGLVMSGIISSLGQTDDFNPFTVVRQILVSIAFAVFVPLLCWFAVKPVTIYGYNHISSHPEGRLSRILSTTSAALTFHTLVLIALVTGASYAGTSVLFAAYLAGACSTWWDSVLINCIANVQYAREQRGNAEPALQADDPANSSRPKNKVTGLQRHHTQREEEHLVAADPGSGASNDMIPRDRTPPSPKTSTSQISKYVHAHQLFEQFYQPALQYLLKPFFFASIGFAIPISNMFEGAVIWKGVVYSISMIFGKLLCGLCLLSFSVPGNIMKWLRRLSPASTISSCWPTSTRIHARKTQKAAPPSRGQSDVSTTPQAVSSASQEASHPSPLKKPVSLYPAAMLGSAMVARGEIGFLVSSVAESDGVFGKSGPDGTSELFLVVTWAILICTILGPITVGLMVRRVKRLQAVERSRRTGREDPLGSWGIIPTG